MYNPIRIKKKRKRKRKRKYFHRKFFFFFFITFTKISILNRPFLIYRLLSSSIKGNKQYQICVFVSFFWRNIVAYTAYIHKYTKRYQREEGRVRRREREKEREREKKERRIYWRNSRANVESVSFIATSDWTNHANTRVGTHYGYTIQRELKEMLSKLARRFDRLG